MADLEKVLRKTGWFDIPGVRRGQRSLAEQMTGLEHALAQANGKTVLDLGCAEGLIAIEFARVGATVTAVEQFDVHALVAQKLFTEHPTIDLVQADYQEWKAPRSYDIVLALAVLHKAESVQDGLRKILSLTAPGGLLVFRWPSWVRKDMVLRSKHSGRSKVNTIRELSEAGFTLTLTTEGPRSESVQYWRRNGLG